MPQDELPEDRIDEIQGQQKELPDDKLIGGGDAPLRPIWIILVTLAPLSFSFWAFITGTKKR